MPKNWRLTSYPNWLWGVLAGALLATTLFVVFARRRVRAIEAAELARIVAEKNRSACDQRVDAGPVGYRTLYDPYGRPQMCECDDRGCCRCY